MMKRMEMLTMVADGILLGIALTILAAVFQEMIWTEKEEAIPWTVKEVALLVTALVVAGGGATVWVLA